ncbi:hypothetical protein ABPG75_011974 [Micractinium tetrahymenae]
MAERRRFPVLPVALGGGLVLLFILFSGGSGGGSAPPSGRLLQSLAAEAQVRPPRQAARTSLVAGAAGEPSWGPVAARTGSPGSSKRGGKYVVTSVMDLDPERLNVFVASLRRHSPHTQLVVFVEEQTDSGLLKAAGAEVIPFKMPSDSALVLHRFELYRKYLADLLERDSEAGVILTDSRDVLIQSDPWEHPLVQQMIDEDAMLFSLEGGLAVGDVPIRAQPQNAHWIDTCFGEEMTRELEDAPISCAGITIGSVAAVHAYCDQLLEIAYKGDAKPKCRHYGSDQAIHNYMLHYLGPRGRLHYAYHVRRNWESPVHTAGYGWPITIDTEGVYRRVNGSFVPPIVHQYDRAFEATKIYLAMYPLRGEEVRWEGPNCVKNLYLDTVTQCPEEGGKDGKKKDGGKDGKKGGGGKGGADEERR